MFMWHCWFNGVSQAQDAIAGDGREVINLPQSGANDLQGGSAWFGGQKNVSD
jgi:hypothetical protein